MLNAECEVGQRRAERGRGREGSSARGRARVEAAGADAAKGGEVAAAAELRADVVAERADVGALGAADGEARVGDAELVDAEGEDVDEARLALDLLALAGHLVERDAVDLDRGDHRRNLEDVAGEVGRDERFEPLARDAGGVAAGDDLASDVLRVRGCAEAERALVGLVARHGGGGELRAAADEEDQKAGRLRVERASVADLLEPEHPSHRDDDVARGDAGGLVDEQDAVRIGARSGTIRRGEGGREGHGRQSPAELGPLRFELLGFHWMPP